MKKETIKTYITYFDDKQIDEYNLKADENTILFKGNDESYTGETLNDLNTYYCELCTLYYVWQNDLKSDYVVFRQYRRPFDWQSLHRFPKYKEVITYEPLGFKIPLINQFAQCHGGKRANDLINLIDETYGTNSKEMKYFTNPGPNWFFTNNTMVLRWNDFCNMCEYVFSFLFKIDEYYNLDFDWEKYKINAMEYTEDYRYDYQMHWMAYIGERMVSCYILNYMKPILAPRMQGFGFYESYN